MERQKFSFGQFIVPDFWKKLAFMLPAVMMMGVMLSILIEIGWGTDPASFMNLNIAYALGLSLGNTQVIVYSLMLVLTVIFGVHMIGFGTLANMLLIGYIADFCRWVWRNIGFAAFIQQSEFPVRAMIFAGTIIVFVIVAAIYINARMGTAPYDALPVIISNALPKVPPFLIRIAFDFSAVGIGLLASLCSQDGIQGSVIGSVCMSLVLGPVISLVGKVLSKVFDD